MSNPYVQQNITLRHPNLGHRDSIQANETDDEAVQKALGNGQVLVMVDNKWTVDDKEGHKAKEDLAKEKTALDEEAEQLEKLGESIWLTD